MSTGPENERQTFIWGSKKEKECRREEGPASVPFGLKQRTDQSGGCISKRGELSNLE